MSIGIVLTHTAFSEVNYLVISEVNKMVKKNTKGICLFVDNISSRVIEPKCAVVDTGSASKTAGTLIAFDIASSKTVSLANTTAKKVVFLYDVDWIYNPTDFNYMYDLVHDPDITIITRPRHKRALYSATGKYPDRTMKEINLEKLNVIC